MSVTIAVVSYNVAPLLARCLASAQEALREIDGAGETGEIVVVDNASRDGSAALVRERFPKVTLVANQRNAGFGAACNQALASAGDLTLFLNSDAALRPGALPALVERLRLVERAAVVGPRVEYPDGRPQPTRRRFPTLSTLLVESTPLQWRVPRRRLLDRYYCADVPATAAAPVDWLSGACLLVRTAAVRQVGGFDARFFMYFEEVDLCRRLAAYGWQTWYEPAAAVIHHHSQSADQDPAARDGHFYRSKYRYAARYWGPAAARALRCAAGATFAAEWAVQVARRDVSQARRYAALTRWHVAGDD